MDNVVTAGQIVRVLHESQRQMIAQAMRVLGQERGMTLLTEALLIEHHGGMWIEDGSRRRSPGGTFLHLCKERSSLEERRQIFR